MKNQRALSIVGVIALSIAASGSRAVAGEIPLTTVCVAEVDAPLMVTHAPGDFDRVFIVSQYGRIWILKDGAVLGVPFLELNLTTRGIHDEGGLLGLAFHPDYQNNGLFYINDTLANTKIVRYQVSDSDPDRADPASALTILAMNELGGNHNGGWLGFGPNDGYLYLAFGDGSGSPEGFRSQLGTNLLGKILRIDVDAGTPYAIPEDNPFVENPNFLNEIWAYGLRNPWRNSFDRLTGDLYIGDVGGSQEEISFQPADSPGGENYGWNCMSGYSCTGLDGCKCNDPELVLPIHERGSGGGVIVGGYVYRGCAIPGLQGTYFFADFNLRDIWSFRYDGASVTELRSRTEELEPPSGTIDRPSSFGEDAYGELYICALDGGKVLKIVPDLADPVNDCNNNAAEDACDILDGSSADLNNNDVPDECECLGDINGDGTVDPLDFGFVLARFGCAVGTGDPVCDHADINGDGAVDPLDIGFVLARFGDCL